MSIDTARVDRLVLLHRLMIQYPDKLARDLQKECLRLYPLYSQEARRDWLSIRTAFLADDMFNGKL